MENDDGNGKILDKVSSDGTPGFDREKYISYAEYLRDKVAMKNKGLKLIVFSTCGFIIGFFNIFLMRFLESDGTVYWLLESGGSYFDMDLIFAYLLVLVVLLIPGIWIGVTKHRIYALSYFGGFSIAGAWAMFFPVYFLPGLYVFVVSFFLLWIVYIVFFKIWFSIKRSVARARYE
ncbi:MAG: hypothetical protein ACTSVI_02435 [Promethearchaeota archaeon]